MTPRWHLQIDTGGTFTDCVAHSLSGEVRRSKVLSDGTLRGKVLERVEQKHTASAGSLERDARYFRRIPISASRREPPSIAY